MIHSVLHLVLQMKKWKKYAWHESPTPLFFQATTWKTTKFPSLSIFAYGKIWLFLDEKRKKKRLKYEMWFFLGSNPRPKLPYGVTT